MALLPKRRSLVTKIGLILLSALCVPSFINLFVLSPRERTSNLVRDDEAQYPIILKNFSGSDNQIRVHAAITNGNPPDSRPGTNVSPNSLSSLNQDHRGGDNHQLVKLGTDNLSNPKIRINIGDTPVLHLNLTELKEITKKERDSVKLQPKQETEKSVDGLKVEKMINFGTKTKLTEEKHPSISKNLTSLSSNQLSSRNDSAISKTDSHSNRSELPQDAPCVTIGVYCSIQKGRWHGNHLCPETNCYVRVVQSENYTKLRDVDALYIPQSSLSRVNLQKLNEIRPRDQLWIFNAFESPVHTFTHGGKWANLGFNWTLSYRRDSTFPSPYGKYNPGSPLVPSDDTTNWAANKTKFAAWIGSNCRNTQWPRLSFVKKLQKFIPLDTFGSCGTKTCPKNLKCGEILRQYKFFFALENSACKDYITEKFWAAPFRNNMIPVVYGPSREDYEKVAPPKSFIHVQDFKTTAELAHYLKLVDENDALFNEYFKWKKQGSVDMNLIGNYYISKKIMCPIGAKVLSTRKEGTPERNTVDMIKWWVNSCRAGLMP